MQILHCGRCATSVLDDKILGGWRLGEGVWGRADWAMDAGEKCRSFTSVAARPPFWMTWYWGRALADWAMDARDKCRSFTAAAARPPFWMTRCWTARPPFWMTRYGERAALAGQWVRAVGCERSGRFGQNPSLFAAVAVSAGAAIVVAQVAQEALAAAGAGLHIRLHLLKAPIATLFLKLLPLPGFFQNHCKRLFYADVIQAVLGELNRSGFFELLQQADEFARG